MKHNRVLLAGTCGSYLLQCWCEHYPIFHLSTVSSKSLYKKNFIKFVIRVLGLTLKQIWRKKNSDCINLLYLRLLVLFRTGKINDLCLPVILNYQSWSTGNPNIKVIWHIIGLELAVNTANISSVDILYSGCIDLYSHKMQVFVKLLRYFHKFEHTWQHVPVMLTSRC